MLIYQELFPQLYLIINKDIYFVDTRRVHFYLIESFNSSFLPSKNVDFVIIIYVAFFASILAFFSWNKGVLIIGPNKASLFLHLIPVFSSIWAISFLNEKFAFFHLIGVFFILTGIILSNIKINNE